MTVVNPKSISGINSITTGSGSDDLLTIHTNNGTERLRIDSTGATKIVTGIVTTLTATTGIVTTLTANTVTSLGAVSGTTGTFSGALSGTTGTFSSHVSLGDSDELRIGDGNDLKLYHDGSQSFLTNSTGYLLINSTDGDNIIRSNLNVVLQPASGETGVKAIANGAVELYHNNIKKLQTSTTDGVIIGNTTNDANYTNALTLTRRGYENSGYGVRIQAKGGSIAGQNGLRIKISDGSGSNYTSRFSFTNDGLLFNSDTDAANALNDYEEGTFTFSLGHSLTPTETDGTYTKIGNFCIAAGSITFPSTADGNHAILGGLPFTAAGGRPGAAIVRYSNDNEAYKISWHVNAGAASASPYYSDGGGTTANVYFSTRRLDLVFCYRTA